MEREEWQGDIRIIRTWATVIVTIREVRRRSWAEDWGMLKTWQLNGSLRWTPGITSERNKWDPLAYIREVQLGFRVRNIWEQEHNHFLLSCIERSLVTSYSSCILIIQFNKARQVLSINICLCFMLYYSSSYLIISLLFLINYHISSYLWFIPTVSNL